MQGVVLRLESLHAFHRDGQRLDERPGTANLLGPRTVLFVVAELEVLRQTIDGETARLHVLYLERDVVVPIRVIHMIEPGREPRMPQLGDSVPQLALLPALGVTLQSLFQEVLLLLVRLIGQASEQHIDVGTGIQVGVFVAKPQQEFFILLTAFLLQRIDA